MQNVLFLVILMVLALPLVAENQEAAVELSKTAEPTDMLLVQGPKCLADSAKTIGAKAEGFCEKMAKLEVKRGNHNAGKVAKAAHAGRPQFIMDGYGYGYYRSYGYGGYRYRGGRGLRPARPLRPNRPLQQYPAPPIPGVR